MNCIQSKHAATAQSSQAGRTVARDMSLKEARFGVLGGNMTEEPTGYMQKILSEERLREAIEWHKQQEKRGKA